jgi:hypothetical protein
VVFFAVADAVLAVAAALFLTAGTAGAVLARAAGLVAADLALAAALVLAMGVVGFASAGFLALMATKNLQIYAYGINSIFS